MQHHAANTSSFLGYPPSHLPSMSMIEGALEQEGEGGDSTVLNEKTPLLAQNNKSSMNTAFCSCHKAFANRKILVDFLAILFGIAAWIAVNGMFVQLPLMVRTQPEGWSLPSYLSVIVQIANIGPIAYTMSQKFLPGKLKDSWIIYVILCFGSTALLLMALFYQKTTLIGKSEHSTALFALSFFISVVGCTSSVLFMPFMGNFKEIYLISYFIGEGLSGFLPSVVALIQGVGGNPVCIPKTSDTNETFSPKPTSLEPYVPPPRFSTETFFIFLFVMMSMSTVAFFLLNNLKACQSEKTKRSEASETSARVNDVPVFTVRDDVESLMKDSEILAANHPTRLINNETGPKKRLPEKLDSEQQQQYISKTVYVYFLILAATVCTFGNGIFPSIQSYSCLPYGNVAYHLSVTLGSMANPMACFLAVFFPYSSVRTISILAVLGMGVTGYIVATALLSPAPPLVGSIEGEFLVVISWVVVTGLITYVKVSIASFFRRERGRALFWCGAVQQLGSAVGAVVAFFLINFTDLFTSYSPCG